MFDYKRVLIFFAVIMFSCTISLAQQARYGGSDREYIIAPDDILDISVYGEPDLSATVRVNQDGTINYPLLGNVKAAGLTVRELESNLTELLGEDYLVMPQVSVFIKEYAKISILGFVRQPGSYQMKERLMLTQAIAMAGGFTDTADTTKVKIIRVAGGEKQTFEVDADQIFNKEAPDIEIKGNDTIVIDEFGRFSIMGQVMRPGVYNLKKGLTVVEAIGLAGGFTTTAAQNGTRVIRMKEGEKKVTNIPVLDITRSGDTSKDVVLQPGDTIVVPESFF